MLWVLAVVGAHKTTKAKPKEPPLRGRTFSIILPFFPPQVEELRESMITLGRHVNLDDLDTFFSVSPCNEERMAKAAVSCEQSADWEDRDFVATLDEHKGRLHELERWRAGRCPEVFSWVPPPQMTHLCDDTVLCGKARGCLLSAHKKKQYEKYQLLGWYVQQMVKLGISRLTTSPHLLVLDADCYTIQSLSAQSLLTEDGASRIISFRSARKGERISKVGGRWAPRYKIALDLLRYNSTAVVPQDMKLLGVTPEILSVAVMQRILDRLEHIRNQPWYVTLAYSRFTEFSLYNTYLLFHWDELQNIHYSNSYRNKQVAVWRHDIDEAPGLKVPNLSDEQKLAARTAYAETRLRNHISSMQHDKRDSSVGHFFICQDESGLTPRACGALAAKCADFIANNEPPSTLTV